MGDLIFSFYGDTEINKEIHDFFEKFKDFKSFDLKTLTDIIEKKGKFRVIVVKDSSYAKSVLEEVKLFKSKNE